MASAGKDNTIKLWDVTTGDLKRTLTGHRDEINAVTFSPDGKTLASASQDNTVKLWDAESGVLKTTLTSEASGGVYAIAFSPNGKTLATATKDREKSVKLIDISEIKPDTTPKLP